MMKYRKKPTVIEAEQWYPQHENEHVQRKIQDVLGFPTEFFFVETSWGSVPISPGDWIIKGVEGEIYPCKGSIFRATYEQV